MRAFMLAATAASSLLSSLAAAQAPYIHRIDKVDATTPAELGSLNASISEDGEHVLFLSRSDNLMPAVPSPGAQPNIFVRDVRDGSLALANVDELGVRMSTASDLPLVFTTADISDDGRFVVFGSTSAAPGLGDVDDRNDLFVRDLVLGQTEWVSPDPLGDPNPKRVRYPAISGDGRYVAYLATNATVDVSPDFDNVMLFDRQTGVVRQVFETAASGPTPITTTLTLSGDGSTLAFFAKASGGLQQLYTYAIESDTLTAHPTVGKHDEESAMIAVHHLSIDRMGRRVALQTLLPLVPEDVGAPSTDVYVFDTLTGDARLVSECYSNGARPLASAPHISGNGRYVAFSAWSFNPSCLGTFTVQEQHVFVSDLATGLITQQSVNDHGEPGSLAGEAGSAYTGGKRVISGDGEYVVFTANHKNLAAPANPTFFNANYLGVYLRERQVDGPALGVEDLIAGGSATLKVEGATPDGLLFVGYSLTGQGPFPSYWGLVDLSPPVMTFPLMADASGAVAQPLPVPAAMAGTRVWMKALDVTGSAPSTTFMGVVE